MARQLVFNGLNELRSYLSTRTTPLTNSIFILFTGSKDAQTGHSWCPDCNVAEPILNKNLRSLNSDAEFITCFVGDRPTWKNPENEFRRDKEFQLKAVPTLIQWKTNKKLVEEQCANETLVQMLFEESDE